jgi:hypothetical protein
MGWLPAKLLAWQPGGDTGKLRQGVAADGKASALNAKMSLTPRWKRPESGGKSSNLPAKSVADRKQRLGADETDR